MIEYKKIVCCYDGTKCALKAMKYALEIASNFNGELYIVYVVENTSTLNILDKKQTLKMLRSYGNKILEREEKILKNNGTKVSSKLLEGDVSEQIIKFSNKQKADLIVVGSKGFGKAARFFLGSVSNNIIHKTKIPVLVTR